MNDSFNPNQNSNENVDRTQVQNINHNTEPGVNLEQNNLPSSDNNLEQGVFSPKIEGAPHLSETTPVAPTAQPISQAQPVEKSIVPTTSVPVQVSKEELRPVTVITGEGAVQRLNQIIEEYAKKENYFQATEEYNNLRKIFKSSESQTPSE